MNKLNRKLTVILLIILIVTVGINSLVLYKNTTKLINSTSRIETKNKADQLADYLSLKIQAGAISDEVKTVIDMMDIQVSILTLNKRVIYSNFTDLRIRKFLQDDQVITSQAPIYNKNQEVVAHVLVAQKNSEIERLNDIFKAALISSITLGIIIVFIFLLVIHLLVNKPLKKIMNALEHDEALVLDNRSDWKAIGDVHNKAREKRMQQRIIHNRFFQNASHELKSPLMNIQGYMEGLEDQIYSEVEASHMVVNETQRIKTLIDQMIRSSKAEIIELEDLEPEEIDMKGFIGDLHKNIHKNIQLDYQGSQATFNFNRTALQIIMDNIIQNAC
ncbi:MAG: hypothetical protein PF505_05625 [Vallitaleaceae bacterium]|jgi:signal transduction histidine kinase|nr:hypothetical protein [Vallitaleaceae bacterium]